MAPASHCVLSLWGVTGELYALKHTQTRMFEPAFSDSCGCVQRLHSCLWSSDGVSPLSVIPMCGLTWSRQRGMATQFWIPSTPKQKKRCEQIWVFFLTLLLFLFLEISLRVLTLSRFLADSTSKVGWRICDQGKLYFGERCAGSFYVYVLLAVLHESFVMECTPSNVCTVCLVCVYCLAERIQSFQGDLRMWNSVFWRSCF